MSQPTQPDNPFGSSPFQANQFGEHPNPYQTPSVLPPGSSGSTGRRGLVNHIRIIAILNIVQGVLELIMGGMFIAMTTMFTVMKSEMLNDMERVSRPGEPSPELMHGIMTGVFGVLGGVLLLLALFRIVASIANFRLKGRWLGVISLILGLASALTMYCAPTGIAIAVYGLVVLFNSEVAEAFEQRKTAESADEVLRQFNARPV